MKKLTKLFISLTIILIVSATTENSENAYAAETVEYTQADYQVIPDKYNTGVQDEELLETVRTNTWVDGLYVSQSGEKAVIDFNKKNTSTGDLVIANKDFSNYYIAIYNDLAVTKETHIVFVNCKFDVLRGQETPSYVSYEFINCSFTACSGCNMTFRRCYFGHSVMDGLNPYTNVNVIDCYFSDKSIQNSTKNSGTHTDGTQIYGTQKYGTTKGVGGNIHFTNCRFEIPQLKDTSSTVNACVMLQIEFNDTDNVTFENCKLNGGGYSVYAWSKNSAYELTNVYFNDISIGCVKKYGNLYPKVGENVEINNMYSTDALYVGTVWTENDEMHVSVSNDTNKVRTLKVVTNNGEAFYTIPACPTYDEITSSMTFESFPFDIDINVGAAEYVICYDVTNGNATQIRYFNTTDEIVTDSTVVTTFVLEESNKAQEVIEVKTAEVKEEKTVVAVNNSEITVSGECGKNVTWTLYANGTLTLEGSGATTAYHSKKATPWNEYNNEITNVVIGEGITELGNWLFKNCTKLESVQMAESVTKLGNCTFQSCKALKQITIPASCRTIGSYCFAGTNLDKVVMNSASVEIMDHNDPLTVLVK